MSLIDELSVNPANVALTGQLHLVINLGAPGSAPAIGPAGLSGGERTEAAEITETAGHPAIPESSRALTEALDELDTARRLPYYDEDEDRANRDRYYAGIDASAGGGPLYTALNRLLERSHTRPLPYSPATHLYPWVDLRETEPDWRVQSIYSGRQYDPEDLIRQDFAVDIARATALQDRLTSLDSVSFADLEMMMDNLESGEPYNCEHVVPQSWFSKRNPMRGDLHHLFTCEVDCNRTRAHYPLTELPGVPEGDCGKLGREQFEPKGGKGAVARATLYFLLRYPRQIRNQPRHYDAQGLKTLLTWHQQDPPGRYERHRNAAIQAKQGNRNPLIDYPEWAANIDFHQGLG